MGSGVSNRKNKSAEWDKLTQTAPPKNAESKYDFAQSDVKGTQVESKLVKQSSGKSQAGMDIPPTCDDTSGENRFTRVAASKKGSSSRTRNNSNSNSGTESGAPTRAATITNEEEDDAEELDHVEYSPRSECSSRFSYGAIDRGDRGDGPYDSNAEKFSYTALSLGMDNEELLFNMMFFGEQGTGAGVDMTNFGLMIDNAQQETVALHSENNTPYKLRPAGEGTIAALQVETFCGGAAATATSEDEEERECRICWDELEIGCDIIRLPKCGHFFHSECLVRWIKLQAFCPVCRTTIDAAIEGTGAEIVEAAVAVVQGNNDGACGCCADTTAGKKMAEEEVNISLFGDSKALDDGGRSGGGGGAEQHSSAAASPNSDTTAEVMRRLHFGDDDDHCDNGKGEKRRGDREEAATAGHESNCTDEERKDEGCDDNRIIFNSNDSPHLKEHTPVEKLASTFTESWAESGTADAAREYVESSISEALNKVHCRG